MKKNKNNKNKVSIPSLFARKYIYYYYAFFWIVLISYIYATVPNFLSVISFRLLKTNKVLGDKIEQISKRYGLSSYVLSIFLIVFLNANLNPDNSSSLISWMAGR